MTFGEVDTAFLTRSPFNDRLKGLVDAVFERRAVPLLGAGVSDLRLSSKKDLMPGLARLLEHSFFGKPTEKDSLGTAAELAIYVRGHAHVCRELEIASWAPKPPAPAHRYLAMLAADGFIDEMITTNYDCCIENAWKALKLGEDHLDVVTDATELHQPRPRWCHCPRLYKINGCASKLAGVDDEKFPKAAEQILLTDTQLQGFRNGQERRWVRDLLRDRTRSRTLVLSGFASDEPQVWHVVRLILEELSALKEKVPNNKKDTKSVNPPRIWVAFYSRNIPFHLLTVLLEEAEIRNRQPLRRQPNHNLDNIFSAIDKGNFSPNGSHKGLDAGVFWRFVWRKVLQRTLSDPQGPVAKRFVAAMTGRSPCQRGREEDRVSQAWKGAVERTFEAIPLGEPTEWAKKEKDCEPEAIESSPGGPGITWASEKSKNHGRYIAVHRHPEYWINVVLMALAGFGDRIEGRIDNGEPRPHFSHGSLRLGAGVAQGRPRVTAQLKPVTEQLKCVELTVASGFLDALQLEASNRTEPRSADELTRWVQRPLLHSARKAQSDERKRRRMHK